MVEVNPRDYYLEVDIYPYPNPALTEILVGDRLGAVVSDYTVKVLSVYTSQLEARKRVGDRHPGLMLANTSATVDIGGFKHDRVVGEIRVNTENVEYFFADEYGRHNPAPGQNGSTYEGHHGLRNALYSVLPPI